MKQKLYHTCLIWIFLLFVITACGGGGGGGNSGNTGNEPSNAIELDVQAEPVNDSIGESKTLYYRFDGVESSTYQVVLSADNGNVIFAVANSDTITDDTVIVVSRNSVSGHVVKFTAPNTQSYFIEVYGIEETHYSLAISEAPDEEIGFELSHDKLDFIAVRNKALPDATSVALKNNNYQLQFSVATASGESRAPWLKHELINDGGQEDAVNLSIFSTKYQVDYYSTSLRVYADNDSTLSRLPFPSTLVYRDIEVNYSVLDLSAESEVNYGENQSFQIEAPNIPDDDLSMSLLAAPDAMSLDTNGLLSWKPSDPMFEPRQTVNWTLRINKGLAHYDLTTTTIVNDPARKNPLFRAPITIPKMPNNAELADFDGDGVLELLLTDNRKRVFTLEYVNNTFRHDWSQPLELAGIGGRNNQGLLVQSLTSGDVNSDGHPDIVIGYESKIIILDGVNKRVLASIEDGIARRQDMKVARLSNTGNTTLVYLAENEAPHSNGSMSVVAYDLSYLSAPVLVWQSDPLTFAEDYGRRHVYLDIDNVDSDDNLEIITASGEIFDGGTFKSQGRFPVVDNEDEFAHIQATDINADGINDIVLCCKRVTLYTSTLVGYSVVDQSIIWNSPAIEPLVQGNATVALALSAANIDATPEEEILLNINGQIYVYAYNTESGLPALAWQLGESVFGHIQSMFVENMDDDPEMELVTLNGVYDMSPPNLTQQGELTSIELGGSYLGGMWTKVTASESLAVFVNTDRHINLIGFDKTGLTDIRSHTANLLFSADSVMTKADYDQDGIEELFMSFPDTYDGYLSAVDFQTNTVKWRSPVAIEQESTVIKHAELTGDSHEDIVSVQYPGDVLHMYDVYNNQAIATFSSEGIHDFEIVETDNSDVVQIVAGIASGIGIYHYNRASKKLSLLRSSTRDSQDAKFNHDFVLADINDDKQYEIVMRSGSEFRVKDLDLNTLNEYKLDIESQPGHLYTANGTHSSKNLLITLNDGYQSAIWLIDAMTGHKIWGSPTLIGSIQNDSLNVVDADSDGNVDFYTLGTTEGMYITQ